MQTHHRPNGQPGVQVRNLPENQLGAVIFGCKHETIEECFAKQLFGLPPMHYPYVKNVKIGMPLFLFNYSDRKLHGIFEAASPGRLSIDPYAWSEDGSVRTPFPAQVRISTRTKYPPLWESQFKTVLSDNYYTQYYFYFELDHAQTKALISLFKSVASGNSKQVPAANLKQVPAAKLKQSAAVSTKKSLVTSLPSIKMKTSAAPDGKNGKENSEDVNPFSILSNANNAVPDSWADLFKKTLVTSLPSTKMKMSAAPDPKKVKENSEDVNPFSILSNANNAVPDSWADSDKDSSNNTNEEESGEPVSDWEDLDDNVLQGQFGSHSSPDEDLHNSAYNTINQRMDLVDCNHPAVNPVNEERDTCDLSMLANSCNEQTESVDVDAVESNFQITPNGVGPQPEKLTILNKLKELSFLRQQAALCPQDYVDSNSDQCVPEETQVNANLTCDPFGASVDNKTSLQECYGIAELLQIIADLTKRTEALEKRQIWSDQYLLSLTEEVKNSGRTVQQLGYIVDELQLKFDSSLSHLGSTYNNLAKPSIFLIGGYNGGTWLSSLDLLSSDKDALVGLKPMGSARSYASAAALDGHIFAFGGGDGMSWYNTVECYSLRNDEWTECPSLNHKKGSLAGISLNGKIYAIGGGAGNEIYSEVEMFDPYLGKWICSSSMLFSRFALAAAELNGVIYAAGGYDGSSYLQSAERYDPREGLWSRLPSMNTRRGCHALTVLGEELYAMGGYNGEEMVSSVEIYDPRLNAWRMGDPMTAPRGYAAAVNMDNSLFLIGGLRSNVEILDTVEIYSASSGWSVSGLGSMGKRCFASAVVM